MVQRTRLPCRSLELVLLFYLSSGKSIPTSRFAWQPSLPAEPPRPYLGILTIINVMLFINMDPVDYSSPVYFFDSVYTVHTYSELKVCISPLSVSLECF